MNKIQLDPRADQDSAPVPDVPNYFCFQEVVREQLMERLENYSYTRKILAKFFKKIKKL